MRVLLTIILFLFLDFYAFAQKEKAEEIKKYKYSGITVATHFSIVPTFEIGYFKQIETEDPMFYGLSYTAEVNIFDEFVIAPKVTCWFNYMFVNVGLSIPWYIGEGFENSLKLKPEIGFGNDDYRINYSFNISITNKEMENVGIHFLSLHYFIEL